MKRLLAIFLICIFTIGTISGCGSKEEKKEQTKTENKEETVNKEKTERTRAKEPVKIGENGELSNEYITVSKYKGLETTEIKAEDISDKDADQEIQSMLAAYCFATEDAFAERAAVDGDTVQIDYVGKKDGVAFEGGTADDYFLELGSNSLIDGFEEGIVGKKIGETFNLNLTFPENYGSEELKGKAVVFTVTLDKIIPKFAEEFVPYLSETAKTAAELKAEVKQQMAKEQMMIALIMSLPSNARMSSYPEDRIAFYRDNIKNQYYRQYYQYLISYGTDIETLLKQMGIDLDVLAQTYVSAEFAVAAIAEAEGYTVTDEIYNQKLAEYAKRQGFGNAKDFETAYGKDSIIDSILKDYVGEVLLANCVYKKAETATE